MERSEAAAAEAAAAPRHGRRGRRICMRLLRLLLLRDRDRLERSGRGRGGEEHDLGLVDLDAGGGCCGTSIGCIGMLIGICAGGGRGAACICIEPGGIGCNVCGGPAAEVHRRQLYRLRLHLSGHHVRRRRLLHRRRRGREHRRREGVDRLRRWRRRRGLHHLHRHHLEAGRRPLDGDAAHLRDHVRRDRRRHLRRHRLGSLLLLLEAERRLEPGGAIGVRWHARLRRRQAARRLLLLLLLWRLRRRWRRLPAAAAAAAALAASCRIKAATRK